MAAREDLVPAFAERWLDVAANAVRAVTDTVRVALRTLPSPVDSAAKWPDFVLLPATLGAVLLLAVTLRAIQRRRRRHEEPCPTCGAPSVVRYRGWILTRMRPMPFCGNCGGELRRRCPGCRRHLDALHRFCPRCSAPLHAWQAGEAEATAESLAPARPEAAGPVGDYRAFGSVACRLAKRAFVTGLRQESLHGDLVRFYSIPGAIRKDMEPAEVARVVSRAVQETDLSNLPGRSEQACERVQVHLFEELARRASTLAQAWPEWEQHVESAPGESERQQRLLEDLSRTLAEHAETMADIEQHAGLLREYHSRYDATLRKDGVADALGLDRGFAAAAFRADPGEPREGTWRGWDEAPDTRFLSVYARGVQELRHSCLGLARAAEQAIGGIVAAVMDFELARHERVVEGLRRFADQGGDIRPITRAMRAAWKPRLPEDDAKQVAESLYRLMRKEVRPGSDGYLREMLDLPATSAA